MGRQLEETLDSIEKLETFFRSRKDKTAIIFADLVGSTLYKQMRGLVPGLLKTRRHNKTVSRAIEEQGGTVVKYLGDGVLGRFDVGTRIDEAVCAINAAILIHERFEDANQGINDMMERIESRIGIGFGVVADFYGNDPQGPTVDLASRIQSLAKPGQILAHRSLVGASNLGRIGSRIGSTKNWSGREHVGDPVSVRLKGVPEPQDVVEIRWRERFLGVDRPDFPADVWDNYQYNAILFPLQEFPEAIRSRYFGICFDLKYRAVLRSASLHFVLVDSIEQLDATMKDAALFSRYMLPRNPTLATLPLAQTFDVVFLTVEDLPVQQVESREETGREYYFRRTFMAPGLKSLVGETVTFHYQTKTIIAKRGNFFAMVTEYPVRGLSMSFDAGAVSLRRLKPVDYFATRTPPRFVYTPNRQQPKKIELHVSEMIPPRGGVVFVWDLERGEAEST